MVDLARAEDVPAMAALSNAAAESGTSNFATEPEPTSEWMSAWQKTGDTHPWLVARTDNGKVAGFAKGSPHRSRGAYRWSAEVSVYVDETHHRSGIGRALYQHLVSTMRAQGYVTLLAGITAPNVASERLHAALGFVACGTYHRVGYKLGAWRDVGYWELHLQPAFRPPTPPASVTAVWPTVRDLRARRLAIAIERSQLDDSRATSLVAALDAELSATYPEPGATHFRLDANEIAPDRGGFFVASSGASTFGCGAVRVIDDATTELKRMFVLPEWRGLGISRALLEALETESLRLGARRVLLETGTRQREALALYERAGYQRIAPFGEYVDSPLSVCMAKVLPNAGQ